MCSTWDRGTGLWCKQKSHPLFPVPFSWPGGVVFPECVSGADEEPEEVSVAAKVPDEATSGSQETKERNDFFSDSEDEVSKDLAGSSGISSRTPCMGESLCCKSGAISAPCLLLQPQQSHGL